MAIVIDELEATVLPDTATNSTDAESGATQSSTQSDPQTMQSTLVRMMERADRLRAD